jgi:hypothetical protein
LRSSRPPQASPFVAFVVAADRGWLCDSYLHVYKEFENCAHEPGRPFGLIFVDKIFDVGLRIPTVPAAAAQRERATASAQAAAGAFAHCTDELAVRRQLRILERSGVGASPAPDPRLRREAVMRLADLELKDDGARRRQCLDTARHLDELLAHLDPGPAVQRQLDVAYCVKRTTQLLAGHEIDDDADAIYRLGLWTTLELKWPFLGEHLSRHPADLAHLVRGTVPEGIGDDLAVVFTHPAARRLADGFRVHLSAADVERFTTPRRDSPETAGAGRDAPFSTRSISRREQASPTS